MVFKNRWYLMLMPHVHVIMTVKQNSWCLWPLKLELLLNLQALELSSKNFLKFNLDTSQHPGIFKGRFWVTVKELMPSLLRTKQGLLNMTRLNWVYVQGIWPYWTRHIIHGFYVINKNQAILAHHQRTEKTASPMIVHKLDIIKKAMETNFILHIILGGRAVA